jgi:non-ribosomal peptide synthetase component E (peptide arylation enzyme)
MWDDKWTAKTIGTALDEAMERYGDKVATVFQNGEITYNQLKQKRSSNCENRNSP